MPTKRDRAFEVYALYMQTENKEEFIHAMKTKQHLYDGDIEFLWVIINHTYSEGFNDCYGI